MDTSRRTSPPAATANVAASSVSPADTQCALIPVGMAFPQDYEADPTPHLHKMMAAVDAALRALE
jgi:hypothetical protein